MYAVSVLNYEELSASWKYFLQSEPPCCYCTPLDMHDVVWVIKVFVITFECMLTYYHHYVVFCMIEITLPKNISGIFISFYLMIFCMSFTLQLNMLVLDLYMFCHNLVNHSQASQVLHTSARFVLMFFVHAVCQLMTNVRKHNITLAPPEGLRQQAVVDWKTTAHTSHFTDVIVVFLRIFWPINRCPHHLHNFQLMFVNVVLWATKLFGNSCSFRFFFIIDQRSYKSTALKVNDISENIQLSTIYQIQKAYSGLFTVVKHAAEIMI